MHFEKSIHIDPGENVANEMISHYEKKYGVRDFFFTDSPINGNLKKVLDNFAIF